MVLPVSEALSHVTDTLGAASLPAVGGMRILNDAGQYLMTVHHWTWAQTAATLSLEADQDHVWLPRDFRDLVAIEATAGLTGGFTPIDIQGLVDLRTKSITTTTTEYWYAITYAPRHKRATGTVTFSAAPADGSTITIDDGLNPPLTFEFDTSGDGVTTGNVLVDTSASGLTAAQAAAALQTAIWEQMQGEAPTGQAVIGQLEIDATVSAAVVSLTCRIPGVEGNVDMTSSGTTNATLVGMRGGAEGGRPEARLDIWPTPSSDDVGGVTVYYRRGWHLLDQDEEEVSIPEWLETVYLQLVRAHTRGYVEEDVAGMDERIARIRQGPHMLAAIARDAEMQPTFGIMEGGAAQQFVGKTSWPFNFTGTADPS